MAWANDSIAIAANVDYREGASSVTYGNPVQWAANPGEAAMVTLTDIDAEGTSSFTSAFRSAAGPASPFPVTLQQVTDATFSCKPTGDVDSVKEWTVTAFNGSAWAPAPGTRLVSCPPFVPAGTGACITPLLVAWQPLK